MINQPLLETLGLTLLSEEHITVVSYISCELHSVKIDKQRTSKPMEGQHCVQYSNADNILYQATKVFFLCLGPSLPSMAL